jgi:diguanylate cyclase (GGDEF)-like protein/PAS domain S-box-containing protein
MRLNARIAAGVAFAIFIPLVIGIIAVANARNMRVADQRLFDEGTIPLETISNIAESFERMRIASRDLLESEGPEAAAKFDRQLDERSSEIEELSESYAKTSPSPEAQIAFQRFRETWKSYLSYVTQLRALAKGNRIEEGWNILHGEPYNRLIDAHLSEVKQLKELQVEQTKQLIESNNVLARTSELEVTASMFLAIICIVGGSLWLNRLADHNARAQISKEAAEDANREISRDLSESEKSEARYRGLLEAAPDAMVVVNQDGAIVLLNVQAEKQFGYRRDELVGQKVKNIIPEGFAERLIADALRSAEDALAQQIGTGIELNGRRKDGSEFPIEIMLSPLESAEGIMVTAAIRDITTRKKAEAQMTHSAEHDFLTDLPNRMLLNDRVKQAIILAERHRKKVAVLFLDLDGFKHINDSLGHPIGDKLLQSLTKRLVDCVRGSDTVSRQGGDEFVVLLSEVEQSEDAAIAARRMLKAVAGAHPIDKHDLHVTTSIGVSVYPDDGLDAETLIKNADTAMYQAKENGQQSYQFFKPAMNVRAVERQSIEESLRRALERQEFALHYQPKINLRTGQITGAEALLRWAHPIRGPVSPAQFIPVAEDCGLILPIGNWVLREAFQQARVWVDAGLPLGTMAVNISAIEFRAENFLDGVFAILKDTGLDPRFLELELTESVLMKHAESTVSILKTLRARGVQVAVDDFGTGYSSLSYLRKFSIDALKIDQSFVRQITTVPDETTIVTAVISMGRNLKLRVVAEGVETQEELAFLQAHQCDEAQGYYFSRPVLPQQFAKLLKGGITKAESAK